MKTLGCIYLFVYLFIYLFYDIRGSSKYNSYFCQSDLFAILHNQSAQCFQLGHLKNLSHGIVGFSEYLYVTPFLLMSVVLNVYVLSPYNCNYFRQSFQNIFVKFDL